MDTRQTLIDIALKAFLQRGYDNVPLKEIADAAGIKTASIYYHFTDKHALFEACTQTFFEKWHQWMGSALRTDAGLEALIRDVCGALGMDNVLVKTLYGADTDAGQYRFLLDVAAYCPQTLRHMHTFNAAFFTLLEDMVGKAQNNGIMRRDITAQSIYVMLSSLMEGANILRFTDPDIDIETETEQLFHIIWGGICHE